MNNLLRQWRYVAAVLSVVFFVTAIGTPIPSFAATTGTIDGTVKDASTGAPIANATVTAASPSGTRQTHSDSHGYYTVQALYPDTYTVSFQATGYEAQSVPGVTVQQNLTTTQDVALGKALKTIASAHARSAGNLVKPNVTSDVYTVSGQQLNALSLGNNLHKTLYQYIQGVPGVTSSTFPGQPRIHGGSITDIAYEFDGIPIKDRITGFFTTNLSNVGMANVEVFTGGLSAGDAASGLGIINTVVKTGTYPSFLTLSYGTTLTGQLGNSYTVEYGGATPNRRFSWYAALDKTTAVNRYSSGLTYPAVTVEGLNGPGPVKTTDIIGNFHYRPNNKDDFQFLVQNGIGDFIYDYGMNRAPGEPVPLTANLCPGAVAATPGTTYTGATGGVAPNGQPCPIGFYFGTADGDAFNVWHHYSGIGKIQWNHIINDHSMFALRVAENFNQYIFDQPIVEANIPSIENSPDFQVSSKCPALPYAAGTPIQSAGPGGRACLQQANWLSTGFYGDRRSNMWLGSLDYTNDINPNLTVKAGVGQERDNNVYNYYYTFFVNPDGTCCAPNFLSDYPTELPYAYANVSAHVHKFLLSPGLRYQRMYYGYPGGGTSVGIWNPTFSFTYAAGANDVIRGSYTNSTSFVGSGYVYRIVPANALNSGVKNGQYTQPYTPYQGANNPNGFSADPTIIHSWDLQWEHQIDATTSIKFGPYWNKGTNYFELYKPITGFNPNGSPIYGPQVPYNGGIRQAFGFELGLNHVDTHEKGISYWLSGTYDNFWTSILSSLTSSYNVTPLNPNIVASGHLVRSTFDPLFSASLTADLHNGPVHLIPLIYAQTPSIYNIGVQSICSNGTTTSASTCLNTFKGTVVPPYISQAEKMGTGWWSANMTLLTHIGSKQDWTIGIQGTNILDNVKDIAPCNATVLKNTPSLYAGCSPFWPSSPAGSNVPSVGGTVYQNYSQTPETWMLFLTKQLP